MCGLWDDLNDRYAPPEVVRELARIALVSLDAPPEVVRELARIALVSLDAPPASERVQIRREHAGWSDATFGNVGPVGPLKHLSKEAMEAAAAPSDPLEWADMQFLLWDAQRRTGITDEQITQAMVEKLAINKARQWPEPKDGEPRLHIKEQPAQVVPEDISGIIERFQYQADHLSDWHHIDEHSCKVNRRDLMTALEFMDSCRAAMLQSKYRDLSQPVDPQISEYEKIMLRAGWISCSERMPAQDDWVLLYSKHGEYLAGQVQGEYVELNDGTLSCLGSALHWMQLPAPPQQ
ncbi:DUF550 domain-containing protein [Salmonella enterica]|nr:DUF550 domain-containing protein [Salmonella enterica]EKS4604788.1 DUF550 domain-containing protein [Salmonella enterica]EKS4729234.1 DUF550 domain-containing protein [Salmonella enterica]